MKRKERKKEKHTKNHNSPLKQENHIYTAIDSDNMDYWPYTKFKVTMAL